MLLEFIDLNSRPVVAVNGDNRKAMGNEKWHRAKLEKSPKNDNIEYSKKKMTKWKSNLKSIKTYYVSILNNNNNSNNRNNS